MVKEAGMDEKGARIAFLGLAIGGAFGLILGAASGNALVGLALGALAGVFIGWFVAASMHRRRREEGRDDEEVGTRRGNA